MKAMKKLFVAVVIGAALASCGSAVQDAPKTDTVVKPAVVKVDTVKKDTVKAEAAKAVAAAKPVGKKK